MKTYAYTTQRELRAAFWAAHRALARQAGCGHQPTDTRVAFVDWIDSLARDGQISQALAQRATLG